MTHTIQKGGAGGARRILQGMLCQAGAGTVLMMAALATAQASTAFKQPSPPTFGFEDVQNVVSPNLAAGDSIYAGKDQFTSNGYIATVADSPFAQSQPGYAPGLAGAIVNGSDLHNCDIIACPAGNASKFYTGLNDSSLSFTRSDNQSFHLQSMTYAFVAPIGGLPDGNYGRLVISGTKLGGGNISTEIDFGGQEEGQYLFNGWISGSFGQANLTSVTISACLFDGVGGCVNNDFSANQAQFAIDNVRLTEGIAPVPEPATYLMMGLGLACVAGATIRRRALETPTA